MNTKIINTTCCIAGGGPAAMMTGFLLARAGIDVVVVEKHADFLRDFRGDTIHPSTFELLHELGLLNQFLQLPHQEVSQIGVKFEDNFYLVADFSHLTVAKPVIGLIPQWEFLNFLKGKATVYPNFQLIMDAKVIDLLKENRRVTGVVASTPDGMLEIRSSLVIGADGRHSIVREKAGLQVISSGASIDVLWFRLQKNEGPVNQSFGRVYKGKMLVLIDRKDYFQCGYIIAKGQYEKLKEQGIQLFKNQLQELVPFLKVSVANLKSWEEVSILTVTVDHLKKWYDEGVICIGDAAHAMSPVGGVGINLAIQDAVATANILFPAFKRKDVITSSILKKVQQRRAFPARLIQRFQIRVHKGIIERQLNTGEVLNVPFMLRLLNKFSLLRRIPALVIGMGVRREHIQTPAQKLS